MSVIPIDDRVSERPNNFPTVSRSEEHTSELQSQSNLVCRLLLEKKKPSSHPSTPTATQPPRPTAHCGSVSTSSTAQQRQKADCIKPLLRPSTTGRGAHLLLSTLA